MRIQVECRRVKGGESEPRSFLLGKRRLWILRVLESNADAARRCYTVKTTDGRRFALEQDLATGEWQLGGVMPRAARP